MQPILRFENLQVHFITGSEVTTAVKNISLSVGKGELVALVGESGSGKSVTSLSVLRLLPKPPAHYPAGKILFAEEEKTVDLLTISNKEMQQIRGNKIAMIFQEPMTSLNPVMTCGEQVMESLRLHKKLSGAAAKEATIAWFEKVKLPNPEVIFYRYPHQLSGGQKQRVMIAMAVCCKPQLLICDEPTTALDVTVQKTVLDLIKALQAELQMGVLFITHDLGVVSQIADRVAMMYKGEIVEEGATERIFNAAQHPYTKALLACRTGRHAQGERLPTVSDYMNPPSALPVTKIISAPDKKEMGETLLQVENLTIKFPGKTNFLGKTLHYFTAVNDVSFSIYKNETLGIVGESGCGKTTLGRSLLGLVTPASGSIWYKNKDISKLTKGELKGLRKDVQLIFQDPYSSLNPRLTIGAALAEPMMVAGLEASSKERKKKVAGLLDQVGMPSAMMNRYPHEFSGGQRQRIVIARALSLNPNFLVCDESVSALDVSVQAQVLNLLNDLKKELDITLLFISHDLSVVRYMCQRVLVMQAGSIVESGTAENMYNHPQQDYTKQLLQATPALW